MALPAELSLRPIGGLTRTEVAVTPPEALHSRPRLFAALEQVFPITFVAVGNPIERGAAAEIVFGRSATRPGKSAMPRLTVATDREEQATTIEMTPSRRLDSRLRERRLAGRCSPAAFEPHEHGNELLAEVDGVPVWSDDHEGAATYVLAAPLPELAMGEGLRDRISPGQWLGGVALIHFLRAVCAEQLPQPPALRASIIVDDPNLRSRSYGRIDFREVVEHADKVGYHLSIATIPLDLRFASREAVLLFKDRPDRLSLAVHGNDHIRRELADRQGDDELAAVLAQAMRRVLAFEERTGLRVARVMAPPHEALGRQAIRALPRLGFEAAVVSRAFPWIPLLAMTSPYIDPDDPGRTTGFEPAEVLFSGLPVIVRHDFGSMDVAVLLAFLDQPMLFYGHEPDFADHLAKIEQVARTVNRVGDVGWADLEHISRSNFWSRRDGETLCLQPFARRIDVPVPQGVRQLIVEPLLRSDRASELKVPIDAPVHAPADARVVLELTPDELPRRIEIVFTAPKPLDPQSVRRARLKPSAIIRRAATETRDRLKLG